MKNSIILYALVGGLFVANVLTLSMLWRGARPPAPGHFEDRGGPREVLQIFTRELNWNDAQIKQFETLRAEHVRQTKSIMDGSRAWHDQYFQFLGKAQLPDARLDSLSSLIAKAEKEKTTATFDHFSKVRAICTPAQRQKFDDVIQRVLRTAFGPPPEMRNPPPADAPAIR